MKKVKRYFFIGLFLVLLILVRVFQNTLFYDPLIDYYKENYLIASIPEINTLKYFLNILFRYVLNTALSLGIIHFLFKESRILIFSVKIYFLFFIILASLLLLLMLMFEDKMLLFYIRRFLIQPLFLFILIPAFYYQRLKKK
jgi:exosortase F-associated protein